jgi:hypothetical protein
MLAVLEGKTKIVWLLLSKGADTQAKNVFSQTALDIATKDRRTEIIKLLTSKPAGPPPGPTHEQLNEELVMATADGSGRSKHWRNSRSVAGSGRRCQCHHDQWAHAAHVRFRA